MSSPRILLGLSALTGALLVSCVPYPEGDRNGPNPNPKQKQTVTTPEQQDIQRKRDELKRRDEEKKKAGEGAGNTTEPGNTAEHKPNTAGAGTEGTTGAETKPKPKEKKDWAFANPIPGKDGFVFSPYNNKVVDVRGIPSGVLVQDPNFPDDTTKRFRVP